MKRRLLTLILCVPLLMISQEVLNIKKADLIGKWKFDSAEKNTELSNDSINKILTKRYGGIEVVVKGENVIRPDIEFTDETYITGDFESDLWTVSNNIITAKYPVPKDRLDYYKANTVGVIEKSENGNYYFVRSQNETKIVLLDDRKLILEDFPYDLTYIKE